MEKELIQLLDELITQQRNALLKKGEKFYPYLTEEDLLQPNDFPDLENNPLFRYEEGTLHGMQAIQTALQNFFKNHAS